MADAVIASFSITLESEESDTGGGSASAEVDARSAEEGGDNATRLGKTSGFLPGESIAFLLHKSANLEVVDIFTTLDDVSGASVSGGKEITLNVQELLFFESLTKTVNLSKSLSGNLSGKWIGNNLGSLVVLDDNTTVKISIPDSTQINESDNQATIKRKKESLRKPGAYMAEYSAKAQLYRLNTPTTKTLANDLGTPPYEIKIVIYLAPKDAFL